MADTPAPVPFWHRSRVGWVNGLGFALTLFLALWLLLALFSTALPDRDAFRVGIPWIYVVVALLAQAGAITFCSIVVFRYAWFGADFSGYAPRMFVFLWTWSGLLFYLCQMLVLIRFGCPKLPNVATWASDLYWGAAPIGLIAFGLMAYVNAHVPTSDEDRYDDEYAEEYEDYDEAEDVVYEEVPSDPAP